MALPEAPARLVQRRLGWNVIGWIVFCGQSVTCDVQLTMRCSVSQGEPGEKGAPGKEASVAPPSPRPPWVTFSKQMRASSLGVTQESPGPGLGRAPRLLTAF